VISTIGQVVEDWMYDLGVSEETRFNGIKYSLESATYVTSLTLVHLLSDSVYTVNSLSEDEHVALADLLSDFDVSTVHGSDNQTSIHDELHV
jgi:hypothetical protein